MTTAAQQARKEREQRQQRVLDLVLAGHRQGGPEVWEEYVKSVNEAEARHRRVLNEIMKQHVRRAAARSGDGSLLIELAALEAEGLI